MANHVEVTKLHKKADPSRGGAERICAADVKDMMTGDTWTVKCRVSPLNLSFWMFTDGVGCRQCYWTFLGWSQEAR